MEEMFKMYCKGVIGYGPFWDHMLLYCKESMERPDKVLFLKYEDMKEDVVFYIKKLAKFLVCPFSVQEEINGVVEDIAQLCSFEKLKDLEVNRSGKSIIYFGNKRLFRKGEVGDDELFLSFNGGGTEKCHAGEVGWFWFGVQDVPQLGQVPSKFEQYH